MGLGTSDRLGPFIKRPSEQVKDAMNELETRRFLLVGRPGPTCFTVQEGDRRGTREAGGVASTSATLAGAQDLDGADDADDGDLAMDAMGEVPSSSSGAPTGTKAMAASSRPRKFKVFIGQRQSCSCGGGLHASSTSTSGTSGTVCVHLLFVLHRVLGVPRTNPIAWQLSLTERELDEALRCEIYQMEHRRPSSLSSLGTGRGSKATSSSSSVPAGEVAPRDLDDAGPCPICYDDVAQCSISSLVYCRFGCGNWVHGRCMQQWVRHQGESQRELSCPMCRHPWGDFTWTPPKGMRTSAAGIARHREKGVHYGVTCSYCKLAPISGPRYRCRICSSYNLCKSCFERGEHEHHPFVTREEQHGDELPAERPEHNAAVATRSSDAGVVLGTTSRGGARNTARTGTMRVTSPPPAMPNAPPRASARTKASTSRTAKAPGSAKRRPGSHVPDVSGLVAVGTSLTSAL